MSLLGREKEGGGLAEDWNRSRYLRPQLNLRSLNLDNRIKGSGILVDKVGSNP